MGVVAAPANMGKRILFDEIAADSEIKQKITTLSRTNSNTHVERKPYTKRSFDKILNLWIEIDC